MLFITVICLFLAIYMHSGRSSKILEINMLEHVDQGVVFKSAKEKYVVHAWIDLQCTHCQKMFSKNDSYLNEGITLVYHPLPIIRGSFDKMAGIWCSENAKLALDRAESILFKGGEVNDISYANPHDACEKKIKENAMGVFNAGIRATPALILPDNEVLYGNIPSEVLISHLKGEAK